MRPCHSVWRKNRIRRSEPGLPPDRHAAAALDIAVRPGQDGRRLLMRSPLQALETELVPSGFVRTHRSWIVNIRKVTTLKPEGSGDYTVELGKQSVPLSRRFPGALAKLRNP